MNIKSIIFAIVLLVIAWVCQQHLNRKLRLFSNTFINKDCIIHYRETFDVRSFSFDRKQGIRCAKYIIDLERIVNGNKFIDRGERIVKTFVFNGMLLGYILKIENTLVCVIRGTYTLTEWFVNTDCSQVDMPICNDIIKCHQGYYKIYTEVLKNGIHSTIHEHLSIIEDIIFCGHSLGAGIASVASLDVANTYKNMNVTSFLFGSPKVFGILKKSSITIPNIWRICNKSDVVINLPITNVPGFNTCFIYKHVGESVDICIYTNSLFGNHKMKTYLDGLM